MSENRPYDDLASNPVYRQVAAVDDGITAFEKLLTQLADVPTRQDPRHDRFEEDAACEPTQVRKP